MQECVKQHSVLINAHSKSDTFIKDGAIKKIGFRYWKAALIREKINKNALFEKEYKF